MNKLSRLTWPPAMRLGGVRDETEQTGPSFGDPLALSFSRSSSALLSGPLAKHVLKIRNSEAHEARDSDNNQNQGILARRHRTFWGFFVFFFLVCRNCKEK